MEGVKDSHALPPDDVRLVSSDPNEPNFRIHNTHTADLKRGAEPRFNVTALNEMQPHDAGNSNRHSGSNGHKQRRRKAQFELGDDGHENDEQCALGHDQDTAGEDTEGEDSRPHQTFRDQRLGEIAGVSEGASENHVEQTKVLENRKAHCRREPSVQREDDSLAKTLINSTLTRPMQELGLSSCQEQVEDEATARTLQHGDGQPHQQERPQTQENSRPRQASADTEDSGQENSRANSRAGHGLEKSRSNPPEVVSNDEGHSQAMHKSSASIHESQNLEDSSRPRHRALSRTSPKSKRMSMLLDPSTSTTTLPSLTKVTTHTVMAINPKQTATVGTDPSPSTATSSSSRTQAFKVSSPTLQSSPAIELVSKFLTTGAGAASGHSVAHSVNEDEHPHHHGSGSPGHHRRSPKSPHDKSNATSPQQRSGYTSKFYPASPSRPQLSSSAPKSTTMSNQLIPPTIVTTSSSDEHLPEVSASTISASGAAPGAPFSATVASAIAAAAVAQSNLAGNGSKTGTLSRTQQKLWLQRENLQDIDEDEMARRGRMHKEMDRINREYKCVRMTLDPSLDSLLRCLTRNGKSPLQLQQQQPQQPQLQQQQQTSPSLSQSNHQQPSLLQHQRSLQQLNGHHQGSVQQTSTQQHHQRGHVGLGLHSTIQQNGSSTGGTATVGRNSGKMTLGQMQQLHHQQQHQPRVFK
ncbi:hypothetical protein BGX28_003109 [Mortierella sp. GBA30]|nr:hypothetical protein BGX28_003109 [Mortierella sp. GBA30]